MQLQRFAHIASAVVKTASAQFCRHLASSSAGRTQLYELHVRQGGKMVVFADHWLPIVYKQQSIGESHLHVRQEAGLFDVSHMLQTEITGEHAQQLLESVCVADCKGLAANTGTLSVFTNQNGGIIDDLIVSRIGNNKFYVVSNAGCAAKVRLLFDQAVQQFNTEGKQVQHRYLNETHSLVALQGPKAEQVLQPLLGNVTNLSRLYFMQSAMTQFEQTSIRVTRCGYTGEDGFELSVPNESVETLVDVLLKQEEVRLTGLGARDSLRMEAGLCLYGNDIDESTSPVEAGLSWTIGKRRRQTEPDRPIFPGAQRILAQLNKQQPLKKRRVGLKAVQSGPPARQGATILELDGNQTNVGEVTSGCPSPVLKENIAIGYVQDRFSRPGTKLQVLVRNRLYQYEVVKMPFVSTHYYLPPKK